MEPFKEQVTQFIGELPNWGKAATVGGLALILYIPYKYYTTRPRKSPIKKDYKEGVVYLYQFPRFKCIPNLSPFCLKLETWLRMAEIPYENVDCGFSVRSSEGTLPFVEYNGQEYPDSSFAIRDMAKIFAKEGMENHLNDEQRGAARAFEKLAENSLIYTIAYIRYVEHFNEIFEQLQPNAFGTFTPLITLVTKLIGRRAVIQKLKVLDIGKHSREEVIGIGNDDLLAISRYLGNKHYFTGFKPTRVDATLFGVLAQIVYAPYELPQKTYVMNNLMNIKEFCERMKARFWSDWDECTTKFALNTDWKKKS